MEVVCHIEAHMYYNMQVKGVFFYLKHLIYFSNDYIIFNNIHLVIFTFFYKSQPRFSVLIAILQTLNGNTNFDLELHLINLKSQQASFPRNVSNPFYGRQMICMKTFAKFSTQLEFTVFIFELSLIL